MNYRIIILNNDGTQTNDVTAAPDYYDLEQSIDKGNIKSFTLTLQSQRDW